MAESRKADGRRAPTYTWRRGWAASMAGAAMAPLACAPEGPPAELVALGPWLDSLRVEHAVPGLAFAAFDDEGLLYTHLSGVKSAATGEPVGPATSFEAASISKPLFAHLVFTLAREGTLGLDTPLPELVEEVPEIGYDPRSSALTPRLLLSHRGGLPNWRSRIRFEARSYEELFAPGDTLRFRADPDTEYGYSGEGYVLLQRVVEARTGRDVRDLMRERVFEPLEMDRSSFIFDDAARSDFAHGHDRDGNADKWEIGVPLASTTLHTTATDLARFGTHIASQIREGGPYAALAEPEGTVGREGTWEGLWGPGLGVVTDGTRRYVYHGGNNVIFLADFIYGVEENLGYALLTNSANAAPLIRALQQRVFALEVRR